MKSLVLGAIYLSSVALAGPELSSKLDEAISNPRKKMKMKDWGSMCNHPAIFTSEHFAGLTPQTAHLTDKDMQSVMHSFAQADSIGHYGLNIECPAFIKLKSSSSNGKVLFELQECGLDKESRGPKCQPVLLTQEVIVKKKTWQLDEHVNCAIDTLDAYPKGKTNSHLGTVLLRAIPSYDSSQKTCEAKIMYKAQMEPDKLNNRLITYQWFTDTGELEVSWAELTGAGKRKTKQRFFNYCAWRSVVLDLARNHHARDIYIPLFNEESGKLKLCTWFALNPQNPFGPGRVVSFGGHYLQLPNEFQLVLKNSLLSIGQVFTPRPTITAPR